ncbi:hypothetical protein G7068_16265 [Leucobacter viscericola]|uniref:Uncharacterized protein n=1 Tax=Leucobacter viscericola TaxID=2714935 RepID=A0A6G7XIV5_9MICO|nr:hypothetical protein [Leucobacter viscericola]QIK64530.1 hypothetical protein G7068_15905 [Leucobacter viscericola]QIK64602.1 hypothetical protein G7068_16265 [Leucobacter viscericola]
MKPFELLTPFLSQFDITPSQLQSMSVDQSRLRFTERLENGVVREVTYQNWAGIPVAMEGDFSDAGSNLTSAPKHAAQSHAAPSTIRSGFIPEDKALGFVEEV